MLIDYNNFIYNCCSICCIDKGHFTECLIQQLIFPCASHFDYYMYFIAIAIHSTQIYFRTLYIYKIE